MLWITLQEKAEYSQYDETPPLIKVICAGVKQVQWLVLIKLTGSTQNPGAVSYVVVRGRSSPALAPAESATRECIREVLRRASRPGQLHSGQLAEPQSTSGATSWNKLVHLAPSQDILPAWQAQAPLDMLELVNGLRASVT